VLNTFTESEIIISSDNIMLRKETKMKKFKRTVAVVAAAIMSVTTMVGSNVAYADNDNYWYEEESRYDPDLNSTYELFENNVIESAEYFPLSSLLNKTYWSLVGDFKYIEDNDDYYKITISKTNGNKGRVAIKLEDIAYGNNFDLYLYDANGNEIMTSKRTGNQKEIIKTPEISTYTTYYLRVKPETIADRTSSNYSIKVDEYISTVSVTKSLTPSSVTAYTGSWSTNAYRDMTNLPSDAKIVSAKVSATKGTSPKTYGNELRVKIGNGSYTYVTWKSGNIDLPELIGQNCSSYWYAGFRAYELSTNVGMVSMKSFKLTIQYEYDKLISY
jgi:hypothetical protein